MITEIHSNHYSHSLILVEAVSIKETIIIVINKANQFLHKVFSIGVPTLN